MNDCLIGWFKDCECICKDCTKYISVNSEKGSLLLEEYEKQVEETLKPLKEMWIIKLESGEE